MATEDWFRNTTWNDQIENGFEARLQRSRGAFHKAQYLRIQASYLLDNPDKKVHAAGVRLMKRLIRDFPTEEFSTVFGHEQLGDYYLKDNDFEKAESHFRIVTDHYKNKKSRSGTTGIADLKLAKTILKSGQIQKFNEAYRLCKDY